MTKEKLKELMQRYCIIESDLDDMDIWSCANCDYEDRGSAFNVKETK